MNGYIEPKSWPYELRVWSSGIVLNCGYLYETNLNADYLSVFTKNKFSS